MVRVGSLAAASATASGHGRGHRAGRAVHRQDYGSIPSTSRPIHGAYIAKAGATTPAAKERNAVPAAGLAVPPHNDDGADDTSENSGRDGDEDEDEEDDNEETSFSSPSDTEGFHYYSSATPGGLPLRVLGGASPSVPTYSTFKLLHYLFDLPSTLLILLFFALLSVLGWPDAHTSHYPHNIHPNQLILGAVTWIACEALRKKMFKFLLTRSLGERLWYLRWIQSTPILLLLHTTVQECLRLFAIHLSFPVAVPLEQVLSDSNISNPFTAADLSMTPPHPRPPHGFFTAFDLALGFAAAETVWRTLELLGSIKLYKDVLESDMTRAWLVGEENIIGLSHDLGDEEQHNVPALLTRQRKNTHAAALEVNESDVAGAESDTSEPVVQVDLRIPALLANARDSTLWKAKARDHYDSEAANGNRLGPAGLEGDADRVEGDESSESSITPEELMQYASERKRLELEGSYGCPLYEIPVAIVAVWRLDATLLNLALTLILSLPFYDPHMHRDLPSSAAPPATSETTSKSPVLTEPHHIHHHSRLPLKAPLLPTFLIVLALHYTLSLLWTTGMRSKRGCGLPAISYVTLLAVLGCFLASLALWNALV